MISPEELLSPEELRLAELEGHVGRIINDSACVLQSRHYWNKNHPHLPPQDLSQPWNRLQSAKQILTKCALGEELDAGDVILVQHLIVAVDRENDKGDDDDAE